MGVARSDGCAFRDQPENGCCLAESERRRVGGMSPLGLTERAPLVRLSKPGGLPARYRSAGGTTNVVPTSLTRLSLCLHLYLCIF